MPNFSIALTGLQANTESLNTIGNNLANLNTTGYKEETTQFEDLFYQQIGTSGSGDQLQTGVGVRVSSTDTNFTQGSSLVTGRSTDMELSGSGYFVVANGQVKSLTRAGDFQTDSSGNLIASDGKSVMGYGLNADGSINITGSLVPLQIPVTGSEPAQATSQIAMSATLDSDAAVGSTKTAPVTLYDSLGGSHQATVTFTKNSTSQWSYSITLPNGDASGTPVNNTGTLNFDSSGKLVSPSSNIQGITFSGLSDGASDLSFNFNLFDSKGNGTITETSGTSNVSSTTQNGHADGSYQSFAVDGNGIITATYSNGQTSTVGQVAVAMVANNDGLVRTGDNEYMTTTASGDAVYNVANVGGRGVINGQTLESSNVDITAEFSDLIVAQRAFEANSKTVTTFDSVTESAIQMLR